MAPQRCWSSIVVGSSDRTALRMEPRAPWLVGCELTDGHTGLHAFGGDRTGAGRRTWLLWADAGGGSTRRELDPCYGRASDGRPCTLFTGHDGAHRYPIPSMRGASMAPLSTSALSTSGLSTPAPSTPGWGLGSIPTPAAPGRSVADPLSADDYLPPVPSAVRARIDVPVVDEAQAVEESGVVEESAPEKPAVADDAVAEAATEPEFPPIETLVVSTSVLSSVAPVVGTVGDLPAAEIRSASPSVSDVSLGAESMIQINDYADMSRASLVEVIDRRGNSKTVIAPVTAVPSAGTRPDSAPELVYRSTAPSAETATAEVTEAAAQAAAIASNAVAALPDEQSEVRRQVGDSLRDLSVVLAKLATSLDPR